MTTQDAKLPAVLNRRQLAQLLDLSPATVHRRTKDGTLPQPARIGRRLLWPRSVVERFLDDLAGGEVPHGK